MAFAGTIGPSGALVVATQIRNIKGELGVSYDAEDRLAFQGPNGVYTPARVDTLIITSNDGEDGAPLSALLAGSQNIANADTGALVTAAPAADQHGLPSNFGPGRGRWTADPTGEQRARCSTSEQLDVVDPALGVGSVSSVAASTAGDAIIICRNFHGEDLTSLVLYVECVHSVQG